MFRIGLSTNGKEYGEKLFAEFAQAGIDAMEISLAKDACECFDARMAEKYSKAYGVELWSFHLPFMPFAELDISSDRLKKSTVAYLSEMIKRVSDIGVTRFVIHPSGEPIPDGERDIRLYNSAESLASLADIASTCGACIAVEDLPRSCIGRNSDEMLELLNADSRLRVCLDANHLLHESLTDFIDRVGDKIITTHVSDYDMLDEKHWLPGEGKVDWYSVVQALKKQDYSGVWLYEVSYTAPDTLKRSRDLTAVDFVVNAKEIFENRPITRIY